MAELNFATGIEVFSVNNGAEVSFNPTDPNFVERLFNAFDDLDKKQETRRVEVEKAANSRAIFDMSHKMDAEMREIIDGVFGAPVSDPIFGTMGLYAMADGFPVWCNFLLSVMDKVDTTFAREQKATNPRIQKYTAKYHK